MVIQMASAGTARGWSVESRVPTPRRGGPVEMQMWRVESGSQERLHAGQVRERLETGDCSLQRKVCLLLRILHRGVMWRFKGKQANCPTVPTVRDRCPPAQVQGGMVPVTLKK